MTTLYLDWNDDLKVTPSGSIQLAVGWDEVRQRIVRRVVTNPAEQLPSGDLTVPDDPFAPTFGEGLGAMVAQNINPDFIRKVEGKISSGILVDSAVDQSVPPSIQFKQPNPSTLWAVASFKPIGAGPGVIQFVLGQG